MSRPSRARTLAGVVGFAMAALLCGFLVSSYQACAVYTPSLLAGPDSSDPDAALDGGTSEGCNPAHPPARPTVSDDGGGDFTIVAAFNTIDIGVSGDLDAAVPPFGYDLDEVCTCPGPPSCVQQTQQKNAMSCDDDAGRDNTDIQLFRLLPGAATTGTSQINQSLMAGQYGLLIVVSNYNGTQNDSNVTVDYYVSDGLDRTADGGIPMPNFGGFDHWTIDRGSVNGNQAVYSDDQAYVSGGSLVANMTSLPIVFGDRSFLGGATMNLSGAIIVGQIAPYTIPDSGGLFAYQLQGGTIAGRWPTEAILTTLATIPDTNVDGGFLCGNGSVDYNIIKTVVCGAADISKTPSNDNTSAGCDAISVGMQFTAVPAQLGDVITVAPAPAGCASDAGVPWTDTCQ